MALGREAFLPNQVCHKVGRMIEVNSLFCVDTKALAEMVIIIMGNQNSIQMWNLVRCDGHLNQERHVKVFHHRVNHNISPTAIDMKTRIAQPAKNCFIPCFKGFCTIKLGCWRSCLFFIGLCHLNTSKICFLGIVYPI